MLGNAQALLKDVHQVQATDSPRRENRGQTLGQTRGKTEMTSPPTPPPKMAPKIKTKKVIETKFLGRLLFANLNARPPASAD